MELKNCAICRKIFSQNAKESICRDCIVAEEEKFQTVREYLKENPGASISQVSDETDVSTKKIMRYLKDGRIEISSSSGSILKCEKCGVSITTERFCRECKAKVIKKITAVANLSKENSNKSVRMNIKVNNKDNKNN